MLHYQLLTFIHIGNHKQEIRNVHVRVNWPRFILR